MLLQYYSRFIYFGLAALIPFTIVLGWSSREIWASLFLVCVIGILLLLDALGGWGTARSRIPVSLWLFIGLLITSTLVSTDYYDSLIGLFSMLAGVVVFQLIRHHARPLPRQRGLCTILLISGIATAIHALAQATQLESLEIGVISTFGWKNTFAGFLVFIIPFVLTPYLTTPSRWKFYVLAIGLGAIGGALFFTNSQASWLAAMGGACVTLLCLRGVARPTWRRLGLRLLPPLILCALIVSAQLLWNSRPKTTGHIPAAVTIQTITGLPNSSIQSRFGYWTTSFEIARRFPYLGVGLGKFNTWYTHYFTQPWLYTASPHNYLIYLVTTVGIPATFALIYFLLQTIVLAYRWMRREQATAPDGVAWPMIAATAGAIGLFIHSVLDINLEIPALNLLWWTALGLIYANLDEHLATRPWSLTSGLRKSFAALGLTILASLSLFADNYYRRALSLVGEFQNSQQRIVLLQQSQRLMPLSANTYEALALAYWDSVIEHAGDRQTNMDAALRNAQTAVALDPASAHRHWMLGRIYFYTQTGNRSHGPQAISHLEQAIAYDFHDPTYYRTLAEAYLRLGQNDRALAVIDRGISIYPPTELQKIISGAAIYEQFGLREKLEALQQLRQAIKPQTKN